MTLYLLTQNLGDISLHAEAGMISAVVYCGCCIGEKEITRDVRGGTVGSTVCLCKQLYTCI